MFKSKKSTLTVLSTVIFCLIVDASTVHAATIKLKSGKTVRGRIMDRYNDVIAVWTKGKRVLIPMRDIRSMHKGMEYQVPKVHKATTDVKKFKREERGLKRDPKAEKQRQKKDIKRRRKAYQKKKQNKRKQNVAPPKRLKEKRKSGEQHPKGRKKYKG